MSNNTTHQFKNKKIVAIIPIVMCLCLVLLLSMHLPFSSQATSDVPEFSGNASVTVNGNTPVFTQDEITTEAYELYGELDSYGRCTTAMACIGTELMPTEERESIGSVKPTGWNQNKYPGIVDSDPPYLYNRCHLIGYQLTGENANEKNLVTGTRYMNVEGMLPYENMVADYIYATGNHVLYRVTPVFEGSNLLCSGVQMEAYSVEDSGAGISFNVYCYNVQPGVVINYSDGSNWQDITYSISSDYQADDNSSTNSQRTLNQTQDNSTELSDAQTKTGDDDLSQGEKTDYTLTDSCDYIANKNTKKFHYPSCDSVADMKEKNKLYFNGTRQELIDQGYEPCKRCNP